MKQVESKIQSELTGNYQKYYRLAFSYVHNEQDALDIVQESAYKAIKNCKSVKKEEYISTWIYRIVVNEALSFLRSRKNIVEMFPEAEKGREDEYENLDLSLAIENLEDVEKTIINLKFFEELTIKTISKIVDLNEGTVKSKLYRAINKLKNYLEDKEYEAVIREYEK